MQSTTTADSYRGASLVRYAYNIFIFSIPFEVLSTEWGIGSERFHLSKVTGLVLAIVGILFAPSWCFRRPPAAFWCFLAYLLVVVLLSLDLLASPENEALLGAIIREESIIVQMVVLFWISYNILRDERASKGAVLSLALSCGVLAILQLFGIGASFDEATDRISVQGMNPNSVGRVFSMGLLALVGLAYGTFETTRKVRLLCWSLFGIFAMAIVNTGSRGSALALLGGLLVLLLKTRNIGSPLRAGVIALLACCALAWVSYRSEITRARWESTFEGSVGKRDEIMASAWEMFLERPLLGWGPIKHASELGSRTGKDTRGAHNLYLHVLTRTGLLGAIPFFAALWLCLRAAWRARDGFHGVLPLSMLTCVLLGNMTGTDYRLKLFWIVIAYALASGSVRQPPTPLVAHAQPQRVTTPRPGTAAHASGTE